jgi:hypothetical protein
MPCTRPSVTCRLLAVRILLLPLVMLIAICLSDLHPCTPFAAAQDIFPWASEPVPSTLTLQGMGSSLAAAALSQLLNSYQLSGDWQSYVADAQAEAANLLATAHVEAAAHGEDVSATAQGQLALAAVSAAAAMANSSIQAAYVSSGSGAGKAALISGQGQRKGRSAKN